jgi:hypothetical protein
MSNYFTDYEVLTEDQAMNLLPKGKYEGFIIEIEVKPGRKDPNKQYVIVTVDVYDPEGNGIPHQVIQGCYFKHMLRHLCIACSCLDKYESKTLSLEDLINKTVVVSLDVQEAQNGYLAKNVINDFELMPEKIDKEPNLPFDDEIKF